MSNLFFFSILFWRERGSLIVWNLLCLKPNKFQNFFYPKEIWLVVPNAPYQMWTCLFFKKKKRNIECCFLFLFVIPIELATLEIILQPNILLTSTWMFCWWAGGCGDMWEWSFTTHTLLLEIMPSHPIEYLKIKASKLLTIPFNTLNDYHLVWFH